MQRNRKLLASLVFHSVTLLLSANANAAAQDCSAIDFSSGLPADLAPPWNVFSGNHELLLSAACDGQQVTVNVGSNSSGPKYVFNTGYYFQNNKWNRMTLNCASGQPLAGVWCPEAASVTLSDVDRTKSNNYLAAFVCSFVNGQWECGCKDESCATPSWQIQAIKPQTPVVANSASCASPPSSSLVVNVRDKGAAGNGSQDDTAAIQAAVDQVSGTGGTVFVPGGTYRIDAVKRVLLGSNMTFRMADNAVLKAQPNSQPAFAVVSVRSESNVNIIGGTIVGERNEHGGSSGQQGMGVEIMGADGIVVEGVKTRDNWGDGVYVGNQSSNITVCSVQSDNNRRHGMAITKADGVTVKNSRFSNSHGIHNYSVGIDIEPDAGDTAAHINILNSEFVDNSSTGLMVGGQPGDGSVTRDIRVEGNIIRHNSVDVSLPRAGLTVFGASNVVVANNTIADNTQDGLNVVVNSSGVRVSGNTAKNNGGDGITVYQAPGNTISGNVSESNGRHGFSFWESPSSQISNNSSSGNSMAAFEEFPKGSSSFSGNNFN